MIIIIQEILNALKPQLNQRYYFLQSVYCDVYEIIQTTSISISIHLVHCILCWIRSASIRSNENPFSHSICFQFASRLLAELKRPTYYVEVEVRNSVWAAFNRVVKTDVSNFLINNVFLYLDFI